MDGADVIVEVDVVGGWAIFCRTSLARYLGMVSEAWDGEKVWAGGSQLRGVRFVVLVTLVDRVRGLHFRDSSWFLEKGP